MIFSDMSSSDEIALKNHTGTIGVVVRMSILDTKVVGSIPSINMFSP